MSVSYDYVSASAKASATYIEQHPERRSKAAEVLPQRITFPAQYNTGFSPTANVPVQIYSLGDIQTRAGRGSMAALMYEAITRTSGGCDIWWIPIADNAGGVVATKTLTVTVTTVLAGTVSLLVAGRKIQAAVTAGMTNAQIATAISTAINADLDNYFTAGVSTSVVTLTARNKGLWPQNLQITKDPDTADLSAEPSGVTITIANATTGTTNPTLDTALGNLGDGWHTVLVNGFGDDTTIAASFETAWATRIGPGVKRPFAMVAGYSDTLANFSTFVSARNSPAGTWVPVEGSPNPVFEIASVAAGILARSNDAHPGVPIRGYTMTGIRGNSAYAVWTQTQRDTIVAAGGAWSRLMADGTVQIGDMVTTYKTNSQGVNNSGDSWRFTETIGNIQAKIYSIDYLINADPYIRSVVVDDDSTSSQSYVVRPKTLKADLIGLVDSWIANGWSKNRSAIVAGITVEINSSNPTRLDFYVPDVVAPGLRIVAGRYGWSFTAAA